MDAGKLATDLSSALEDLRLLSHPWYQRWSNGELTLDELRDYAEQYRHFERELPLVLEQIGDGMPAGPARDFVLQNLADETASPSHLQLFDGYLAELDGDATRNPSPAMKELVDTYRKLAAQGERAGLAGVMAYETQAAEVAASKAEGLRTHYGMSDTAVAFWDVHATMDVDHADWAIQSLADVADSTEQVVGPARLAAAAWWNFLDERQALAATA